MTRIARLLNAQAEVWRMSRVQDPMGGWVETWSKVGMVRTRVSQPSASERVVADQSQASLTHIVYLAADADVRRGDELRQPLRTFDVLATFEPSEPGTYLRADCSARQPST